MTFLFLSGWLYIGALFLDFLQRFFWSWMALDGGVFGYPNDFSFLDIGSVLVSDKQNDAYMQ